mmetsp:Transcript_20222/g.50929  ORF Transcript_20222/g.50929 Transcript_20222/m.50929 type:complete len:131 (-) Transcript_20222:105-497(-)
MSPLTPIVVFARTVAITPSRARRCPCPQVFWKHEIAVSDLEGCPEICFRAVDQSQNSMPERPTWNVMGMLNNPWYRVRVHKEGDGYRFEHPTLAGPDKEEGWMVKMAKAAPEGELRWGWGGKGTPAAPAP